MNIFTAHKNGNMKNLYIVGAGGCGREILAMILDTQAITMKPWNIKGFLDDTKSSFQGIECEYPIVGTIKDYKPDVNDVFLMGIADPQGKEKLATMLKARGAQFESFIHPYAALGRHNKIGEGAIIYGGFGMTVNVNIGAFATLQTCYLGHDVNIGDYSTISSMSNIMGYVDVGKRVFMGSNVAIVPRTIIEDDAYVCVGSVVIKNVKSGTKIMGNPAREIG